MPDYRTVIFISAGDPSGDIAGSHLIQQLKSKYRGVRFTGLGGYRMNAAGQEQLVDGGKLAILGFWEVAKKYFFFRSLMNSAIEQIKKTKPKVIILIDYPGFNLRLAKRVRSTGIPIVYYISPQVWAWHKKRIFAIKRLVDLMLVILPFETDIYDRAGVKNRFVGHYLMDDIDPSFIKAPFDINTNLIVLMPGSRPQEVERMLPTLLGTAGLISKRGKYRFAIAAVKGDINYETYIKSSPVPVEIARGKTRELIAQSRLVITSSGTATLETGIIGRPMVVIYKTGLLTYLIARRLVAIDRIALINIAAGEKIVPELIQNDAVPEKIAEEAFRFLNDEQISSAVVEKLNKAADHLGTPGAAARAVESIGELLNC